MSNLNPEIQKILDDHGIDPAPEQTIKEKFDDKFGNPKDQLEDIFGAFGRIFSDRPFHEDRQRNYDEAKRIEDEKKKDEES